MIPRPLSIALLFTIAALSCYRQQEVPDGSAPGDTDADTDADTDTDTDTDSDTDTDADSDTDTATDTADDCGECPLNSGYPCPCAGPTCEDGAACGVLPAPELNASGHGICSAICDGPEDAVSCVLDMGCDAQGECALMLLADFTCALICNVDEDCPTYMYCDDSLGPFSICYGY